MKPDPRKGLAAAATDILDIVSHIDELPSPPPVAARVLGLALDQDLSAADVARIIEADQALALKVLQAANSPTYGLASRVASLEQAVVVLGLPTLQQIVLSIVVRESLLEPAGLDDPVLAGIWRHSLACAVAAELLAQRVSPGIAPLAFTAGLVHDCGKTLLLAAAPEKYESAQDLAQARPHRALDIEAQRLGLDHCQAGAQLLERWNMPRSLIDAAALHHLPPEAMDATGGGGMLLRLVRLGDILSRRMTGEPEPNRTLREEAQALAGKLGLEAPELAAAQQGMEERFASRASLFRLDENPGTLYLRLLQRAKSRLGQTGARLLQATEALERQNHLQQSCLQACLEMSGARSLQEIFAAVIQALRQGLDAADCGVFRLDAASASLEGRFFSGTREHLAACRIDDRRLPCSSAAEAGVPEAFREVFTGYPSRMPPHEDADAGLGPSFLHGFCIAPLCCEGERLGELLLDRNVNAAEAAVLLQLATHTAFAVRRLDLTRQRDERTQRLARALRTIKEMQLQAIQSQRLAAVGQLAAGAAHEINNPLAIVYARAQLLEQKEEDQGRRKSIGQMKEQLERITNILKNLMEFARPDPPAFQDMDLNAVAAKTIELMRGGLDRTGISLVEELAPELPTIQGDPRQVEQVLLNLLLNAVQAMEETGGELRVQSSFDAGADEVALSVADQGPGISPEHRDRLFDPFFTTKPEGKGAGLGLSTSYGIVQGHGGSIAVQSTPGQGAVFTVRLPLRQGAATRSRRAEPASGAAGRAVLVVDDEEHIREILKEALEGAGHQVHTAANGRDGLTRLRQGRYKLVLLDIRMPEKSGLSLLADAGDALADTPVIVLTGLAGPEEVREARNLGATRCIQKPFQIDALLEAVRETLEQADTAAASRQAPPGSAK